MSGHTGTGSNQSQTNPLEKANQSCWSGPNVRMFEPGLDYTMDQRFEPVPYLTVEINALMGVRF